MAGKKKYYLNEPNNLKTMLLVASSNPALPPAVFEWQCPRGAAWDDLYSKQLEQKT